MVWGSPVVLDSRFVLPTSGPVAQLGARMNGIHEVTGSTPVRSTIPNSLILNDCNRPPTPQIQPPLTLLCGGLVTPTDP